MRSSIDSTRLIVLLAIAGGMGACASSDEQTAPARRASLALDHVWIATAEDAVAERAALEHAGFLIAPTINRHDGQGTASATVEFENGFLELIWADDTVPVTGGGAVANQRFAERAAWRRTGSSPFGVALVRTPGTPAQFPFETWRVTAEWMQPGTFMEMLTPRGSPAVNFSVHPIPTDEAANLRIIAAGGEAAAKFRHPNGTHRITTLALVAPGESGLPPSTRFVNDSGALRLGVGREWLMRLTLDGEAQQQQRDLRPTLPLIVRY